MRETIYNVKYLQDKLCGIKYYVICKSQDLIFWDYGQIVFKSKTDIKAAEFKRKSLFTELLAIKDIESVISGRIHK